jgi:hypothetical protein
MPAEKVTPQTGQTSWGAGGQARGPLSRRSRSNEPYIIASSKTESAWAA